MKKWSYIFFLLLSTTLVVLVLVKAGVSPKVVYVFGLFVFIIARLANYQYKDFYAGMVSYQNKNYKEAETSFLLFLEKLSKKPWLKKLNYLNWGQYSWDIEAMAYNNLGAVHIETGDLRQANEWLNKAVQLDANYPKPYFNKAIVEYLNGNNAQSQKLLAKAKELGYSGDSFDKMITQLQLNYAKFNKINSITNQKNT